MDEKKGMWKCTLGFHKWSKWYDLAEGTVSNLLRQKSPALYQERICTRCDTKDRQYIILRKG
jgi:hypothetical protein